MVKIRRRVCIKTRLNLGDRHWILPVRKTNRLAAEAGRGALATCFETMPLFLGGKGRGMMLCVHRPRLFFACSPERFRERNDLFPSDLFV